MIKKILLSLIIAASSLFAGEAKITAAADLVYAFKDIKAAFEKQNPDDKLSIAFGSSGKAFTQITKGAPYDMFFSADMGYVQKLKDAGLAIGEPKPYAYGRIGLWVPKGKGIDISKGLSVLTDPKVNKIAIADPAHAPYGVAATNVLKSQKIYDKLKDKLVLGENVSQAAQFVQSGAADIGMLPISLAYSDTLKKTGDFFLIPAAWHNEIIQGYGVMKAGENNPAARKFEKFVASKEAREIFKKYGFVLPNE
jgi:molybdate transport system substrate-binding protein